MQEKLLSHYRLIEQIGEGGMGVVYRAYDEQLEREVAIKVLPAGMLADETARRRFRREALLLAKVNHPNVGVVFEFGTEDEVSFLVMEFIAGTRLDAKLARRFLPEKEIIRLGLQLADGLAAAHAQGIIHRDLKPANLRLTPDGRLKILDFGLAQYVLQGSNAVITASLDPGQHITGTLPYMAPEQLRGEQLDARADIWAVGAVLYEMATGGRPFPQSNSPLLIDAILNREPEPIRNLNSRVSAELSNVITKCLDKDPARRYQSALELKVDLERMPAPSSQPAEPSGSSHGSRGSTSGSTTRRLQIAHVLCIGVADDGQSTPEERMDAAENLRSQIYASEQFTRISTEEETVSIVDNDGLCLMFFGNPAAPLRFVQGFCTSEARSKLKIRIGIHSGPVYRSKDANRNETATGSTITLAHDLMLAADTGQILVSKSVIDVVAPLGSWPDAFTEVGEIAAGTAGTTRVFTFVDGDVGRRNRPKKLGSAARPYTLKVRALWLIAPLAVAALIGIYAFVHRRSQVSQLQSGGAVSARRSIAVLGFKNLTGRTESDWLSTALSEMVMTDLAAGEKLRVVPNEDVARAKLEMGLTETEPFTREVLKKIRANLGTDLAVEGSYVVLAAGQLRLDIRLQDVVSGETLVTSGDTGDIDHLFDLVSRAGSKLREKAGVGTLSSDEAESVKASLPSTTEAAKLYAEGLAKLRLMDGLAASQLLRKAVEADPNHALAHSALAAAWASLGYDDKARTSAKNAFDLSSGLSRENRLLVEARYREMSKEWDNAVHNYRTLFDFFPDNLDYGMSLARVQTRAGYGNEALGTVETMQRLGPPLNADPRIDLVGSDAAVAAGDFKKAHAFAVSGAEKAKAHDAKLLLARALRSQALALDDLGDVKTAVGPAQQAKALYKSVGDTNGVASVQEVEGNIFFDGGELDNALASYSEELKSVREVGNKRGEASALNNLALVLKQRGEVEKARSMWEQALLTFREINDQTNLSMTLVNIGGLSLESGDLARAKKTYEQALEVSRQANNKDHIASSLTALGTVMGRLGELDSAQRLLSQASDLDFQNGRKTPTGDKLADLAEIQMWHGDLNGARKSFADALSLSQANGDKSTAAYALMGLGRLALIAAEFSDANTKYEQALAIRKELGEDLTQTRLAQAELMIEQGDKAGAEKLIRGLKEEIGKSGNKNNNLQAAMLLVRALVTDGKVAEAQREMNSALAEATKTQDYQLRLLTLWVQAALQGELGQSAAALATSKKLLAQSVKAGYLMYGLEAQLQGEQFNKSSQSIVRIKDLEKEAMDKGFVLTGRRAKQLWEGRS
jgi:serine/threonine protein kinase/tetratricopeptide (TPR) repeat protein/TolB-like protein